MGETLAGDDADLAAAVAVEHRAAEHLFQEKPVVVLQDLSGGDDGVRPVRLQPTGLEEACEQHGSARVGLDDARPEAVQGRVELQHPLLGEIAGVQPHRLSQKRAAQAGSPVVAGPVARRAPDNRRLVADFPARPAVVAQRRRRPRALAGVAKVERNRRARRAACLVADQVGARPVVRDEVRTVFLDLALLQRRQRPQVLQAPHQHRGEASMLEAPPVERAVFVGVEQEGA